MATTRGHIGCLFLRGLRIRYNNTSVVLYIKRKNCIIFCKRNRRNYTRSPSLVRDPAIIWSKLSQLSSVRRYYRNRNSTLILRNIYQLYYWSLLATVRKVKRLVSNLCNSLSTNCYPTSVSSVKKQKDERTILNFSYSLLVTISLLSFIFMIGAW